jgi:2,3-bisphosphoglycerate-dependent phosphoglycerate mutase
VFSSPNYNPQLKSNRMYGALTGLSKQMVSQRHGEDTLKKWRRGYDTRPPPISSFSSKYPGNDDRYISNVQDVRYSFYESLIRSIGHKRIEIHRLV